MSSEGRPAETLGLIAGFGIWSSAFLALYGLHGALCAGGGAALARGGMGALLVLHLIAHGVLVWWLGGRLRGAATGGVRFVRQVSFVLAVASTGATLWTGLPAMLLRVCA